MRDEKRKNRRPMRGKQGRKDSDSKRVNFDNERVDKFEKDIKKMESRQMKDMKKSTDNDISWYSRNKALLEASGRFSFYNVVGNPILKENVPTNASTPTAYGVPGVMKLVYAPSVGPTNSKALKQAMDSMHSYIVHANSRNESYDGPDIMMLVLAGVDVFSAIAAGIRAYGVMQSYSEENFYYPDALLTAMGFNPSDLKTNYSQMWFDINRLIAASKQIWVPNTMPLMERRFWMNTNIYMDGESNKSQVYLFKQGYYFKYNPTLTEQGGGLERESIWTPSSSVTWANYVNMVDDMINSLMNDADRGLIFGDILKAYGSGALYTINELPIDYKTPVSYNQEVLTQMENATFCNYAPNTFQQDINNNNIVATYTGTTAITAATNGAPNRVLLNFHQKEAPTPEQVMIATRLCACETTWVFGTVSGAQAVISGIPRFCGTEYLQFATMYDYQVNAATNAVTLATTTILNNAIGNSPAVETLWQYTAFDWAPHIYKSQYNMGMTPTDTIQYTPNLVFADFENYTFLTGQDLEKLHTTALFSEFGIPIDMSAKSYYDK